MTTARHRVNTLSSNREFRWKLGNDVRYTRFDGRNFFTSVFILWKQDHLCRVRVVRLSGGNISE